MSARARRAVRAIEAGQTRVARGYIRRLSRAVGVVRIAVAQPRAGQSTGANSVSAVGTRST